MSAAFLPGTKQVLGEQFFSPLPHAQVPDRMARRLPDP